MPPPAASAEQLASRLFLGPALRTQSDRRLVTLVREGYEAAFEEIVRRYRRPLDRFAASIVGANSEDVTQDAFSKALMALRGSEAEIELRPWLYRIVRNTALNDLRDSPPAAAELGETLAGGHSAAEEAERRQEMTDLMGRLRALPEPQRAAIVMRELEGLSHEEIAAALGISGGAARQAIFRARQALRDGFGLLLPLPLLRLLIDHGAEAAGAGGVAAAAGTAGTGAALGGVGVGGALKVGAATVLIAGSVGAGVAVEQRGDHNSERSATTAEIARDDGGGSSEIAAASPDLSDPGGPGGGEGVDVEDRQGSGSGGGNHDSARGPIPGEDSGGARGSIDPYRGGPSPGHGGPGPGRGKNSDDHGHRGRDDGPERGGKPERGGNSSRSGGDDHEDRAPGHGGPGPSSHLTEPSRGNGSGRDGGDHSSGGDGSRGSGGNSDSGGSGEGSSGGSGSGPSGDPPPEALLPLPEEESEGSRGSGENDS